MAKKMTESELKSIEDIKAIMYAQVKPKENSKNEEQRKEQEEKPKGSPKKKKHKYKEAEIVAVITKEEYDLAGGNVRLFLNSTPKNLFDEEPETPPPIEEKISVPQRRFKDLKDGKTVMEKRRKVVREKEVVNIEDTALDEYATSLLDDESKVAIAAAFLIGEDKEKISINLPVFKVGVSKESDLVITQDNKVHTVSRNHALILTKNDSYYIKDLSSNGTFIGFNKEGYFRLPKGNEVELKNNMYIKFATAVYRFSVEEC